MMTTSLVLQDSTGADLWQIIPDPAAGDLFSIQAKVNGGWVTMASVDQSTGRMILPVLAINKHPGMPFQYGLSIGTAPKAAPGTAGVNYIKLFSDDPLETYMQVNFGMHTDPIASLRYAFWEAIEQSVGGTPLSIDPQNLSAVGVGVKYPQAKLHVRTIDDATSSTTARDAYIIDGGNLASGWERFIKIWGNGGAVVVGAISAYLNGLERRLRLWAGGMLVAEAHEDGGMTIGNVPSMGAGTLNVAGALYVNGVKK